MIIASYLESRATLAIRLATVAGFTVFIAAFCKVAAFNMTPFRAESGWFMANAWAENGRMEFIKPFLTGSYNGHFTPLFYGAEFLQARIFGANDQLWFWRQMLVLGLLATALSIFSRSVFSFTGMSRTTTNIVTTLLPLVFIFQPTVLELAAWPFMAAQLLCLACMAMSISHALKLIRTSLPQDAVLSLAWAYGSMHLFGIGFTSSVTALLAVTAIVWAQRLPRRFLLPVVIFALLTGIHAFLMSTGNVPSADDPQDLVTNAKRFGALYIGSLQSGARSLWANGRYPWPNPAAYSVDAIYGLASLVCLGVIALVLLWRARVMRQASMLVPAVLLALTVIALPLYCTLVVLRLHTVADPNALSPFLFGTRYLIFPAFFLFVALFIAFSSMTRVLGSGLAFPLVILTTGSSAATLAFFASVGTLWPYMEVRPAVQWAATVSQAQYELAVDGYVHDRPLKELDPELQRNLSEFHGLLEAELECRGCVRFSPP